MLHNMFDIIKRYIVMKKKHDNSNSPKSSPITTSHPSPILKNDKTVSVYMEK